MAGDLHVTTRDMPLLRHCSILFLLILSIQDCWALQHTLRISSRKLVSPLHSLSSPIPLSTGVGMFTKFEFAAQVPLILAYFLAVGPLRTLASLFKRLIFLDSGQDGTRWGQKWLKELPDDISNAVCIVTGSNTGIGFETARELAIRRAKRVVLACRSREKGEAAAQVINQETGSSSARWMALDLSDLSSVVEFSATFMKEEGRLDLLVNNAGVNTKGTTNHGLNESFQINYLGHYILTRLMCSLLTTPVSKQNTSQQAQARKRNPFLNSSRVVNLSSVMHHMGGSDFSASAYGKGASSCYDDSKLYMNLLTLELNKRYRVVESDKTKRPIFSLSVNPGL